jgi:sugar O-acyltransferase (sialic acid O-acetyltransferase NeuD family)
MTTGGTSKKATPHAATTVPAPERLLIFPCNGNALEALDCLGSRYRLLGFVDDTAEKQGTAFGYPVFSRAALTDFPDSQVLAVPGSPTSYTVRRNVIEALGVRDDRFARVLHPSASISALANVGFNFLAMAGVVVTSNATIGNHVCLLPNTVVHHDVVIGDWTLIGSGVCIAGSVQIGENCYIGSGTSIKNGIRIGARALVGLGSAVVKDVTAGAVVVGNPARVTRQGN